MGVEPIPDFEMLQSEIANYHKTLIDAHWEKDVDFLTQGLSEDFLSVSGGEIRRPTQEELQASTSNYLNNTTFTEYRYLREPIITLSKDGSMAWSIAQVKVAGKRKTEDGSERDIHFVCAWVTVFERRGDSWVRLAEVSSFGE